MKDGVIADFTVTEQMLKQFIKKVHESRLLSPSRASSSACPAARPRSSGARSANLRWAPAPQVYLIEEPMAAAIGAELPVAEATGSMVVDIGGGTTEVGVISLGGMVYAGSVRVGGDKFDEAIINYIRRNYGMLIGETTAESIKRKSAPPFPAPRSRRWKSGPQPGRGHSALLHHLLQRNPRGAHRPLNSIVSAVKSALEQTPPELGADIAGRAWCSPAAARCCATSTAC